MYLYMDHRKMINTRILCAVKNTTALFIENGIYVKFYQKSLFRKRRIHTDAIIRNPTSLFWIRFADCRRGLTQLWKA